MRETNSIHSAGFLCHSVCASATVGEATVACHHRHPVSAVCRLTPGVVYSVGVDVIVESQIVVSLP